MMASVLTSRLGWGALGILLGACGDVTTFSPTDARIFATSMTFGDPIEDGYILSLDGAAGRKLGTNVTITLTGGSEQGCDIAGPNPRTLALTAGLQYPSDFKIHCRD